MKNLSSSTSTRLELASHAKTFHRSILSASEYLTHSPSHEAYHDISQTFRLTHNLRHSSHYHCYVIGLLTNTTNTAAYAAVPANSSALLAFVNNPTTPANKDVNTMIRDTLVQIREL
jgi:hypothetical protein